MEEQNQMEREHEAQAEQKRGGRAFLVFLLIVSLLGNGYLIFDFIQERKDDKLLLEQAQKAGLSLDSLRLEFEEVNRKYDELLSSSSEITDSMRRQIEEQKLEIQKMLNDLESRPSWKQYNYANLQVKTFKKERDDLQRRNDSLVLERDEYKRVASNWKDRTEELFEKSKELTLEKQKLEKKINSANFSVSEFSVAPVKIKRSGREQTFKTSKVDELDISFTINASELVDNGKKKIGIRVIGTNNEVLGANNDILTESSKLVSMSEDFDYTGKSQDFHVTFKQDEQWKDGQHTVELVHNGEVIDRIAFILN